MELLEGEELESVLAREGRIEPMRAARILLQVADALRAAHFVANGESILHLDLKPGNVFLLPEREGEVDRVKVIDFGIGQHVAGAITPTRATVRRDDGDRNCTLRALYKRAGVGPDGSRGSRMQLSAACTPEYASPEQCAHMLALESILPLDGRADLYSLGTIAFRMLTGKLPFEPPADRYALLQTKCDRDAPRVSSLGVRVPRRLAAWIDRCLERDREHRFEDLREAHMALARIVSPPIWRRLALPAALVTAALALTLWAVWPDTSSPRFDVWSVVDGTERNTLGTPLYFGPTHASAELRLQGLPPAPVDDNPPTLRLVDGKGAHARDVEGWTGRWIGEDKIEVDGALGPQRSSSTLYVEVARSEAAPAYSAPLELVWIGTDAWHLVDAGVPDLASRELDPTGQSLRIHVQGSADDLAWVGVERGTQRFRATSKESSRDGADNIFQLALDGLGLSSGRAEIVVDVDDRCGRMQRRKLDLEIRAEPLRFATVELEGVSTGERTIIGAEPKLRIALSGRADVAWSMHGETGAEIAKGQQNGVARGEIALGKVPGERDKAISGWIEVAASDAPYVGRASPALRGRATARLAFTYDPMPPDFDMHVVDARTNEAQPLDATAPRYVGDARVTVRVVRKNVVPVEIDVEARAIAKPDAILAHASSAMVDAARAGQDLTLELPADGAYSIEVRARRHFDKASDDRGVEFVKRGTVVLARSAPVLSLAGAAEPLVIRSTNEPPRKAHVAVAARTGTTDGYETPVALTWDLYRAASPDAPVAHGIVAEPATSARPIELELPMPWGPADRQREVRANALDGKWIVRVAGKDSAGNAAQPIEAGYEVGLDGPDLELVRPAPSTVWSRNASGRFEIEVRARDPNGVAELACNLTRRGTDEVRAVVLERAGDVQAIVVERAGDARAIAPERAASSSAAADTTWKGEAALPPDWSHAEVQIDLVGIDGSRSKSRLLHSCSLPVIELALPARIATLVGSAPTCPMNLVRGNHDREYVFGGRVDAEEQELFRDAGLGLYNPFSTPKSWQAMYAPGEIADYYLDEREVSAGEMLAFVSSDAWNEARTWSSGATPSPARRDELAAHLRTLDAEMPATDATWDEADAYARWTGKRLQSWVEWEYALRGGTRYRPWSGWSDGSAAPRPGTINSDDNTPARGPWPGRRGLDVTSDTGIAHLSDNVAEWTATPVGGEKCAATRKARALPVAPLPGASRELFWVAGGSFELARFDFSVADRRSRHWHGAAVGFRCALTATEISRPDGEAATRVRFRAIETADAADHARAASR
jgi:hypothetical protein